jgi:hypothetical protein
MMMKMMNKNEKPSEDVLDQTVLLQKPNKINSWWPF